MPTYPSYFSSIKHDLGITTIECVLGDTLGCLEMHLGYSTQRRLGTTDLYY